MARKDENLSEITLLDGVRAAVFGDVTYRPGGAYGPRIQPDIQFVVLETGSLDVTVNGATRELPVGSVACMHPGGEETYVFDAHKPSHHTWVALVGPKRWPAAKRWLAGMPFCLPLTKRMRGILDLGLSIYRTVGPGDRAVLRSLGIAFAAAYRQAAEFADTARPTPEAVDRARRHIDKHFAEPLMLADIAEAARLSDNHLVRLFGQHVGATPIRYLWQVRVERGAELLRDTGLTISEIAYRVGFTTPYHFSRLIRQRYGVPPKVLRQRYWQRRGAGGQ